MLEQSDSKLNDTIDSFRKTQQQMVVELHAIRILLERYTPTLNRSEKGYNALDVWYKVILGATAVIVLYNYLEPYIRRFV